MNERTYEPVEPRHVALGFMQEIPPLFVAGRGFNLPSGLHSLHECPVNLRAHVVDHQRQPGSERLSAAAVGSVSGALERAHGHVGVVGGAEGDLAARSPRPGSPSRRASLIRVAGEPTKDQPLVRGQPGSQIGEECLIFHHFSFLR